MKSSLTSRQVVLPVVEVPAVRRRRVEHRLEGDVGHRADEVEGGRARRAKRCEDALAVLELAAPGDADHRDPLSLEIRRERLGRGRGEQDVERASARPARRPSARDWRGTPRGRASHG